MQFVYLLQSEKDQGYYIGCTEDISKRLRQHNTGQVESTRQRRTWNVNYYEAYCNPIDAFERERKLKDFGSSYTGLLKRLNLR